MKQKLLLFGLCLVLIFASLAGTALAGTPSLYATSSGNSVTLNINNANANTPVYLYQRQSSSSFTGSSNSLGNTDTNGNFTSTQTVSFDGSSNPLLLYVIIGGLQSPTVQIPPGSCTGGCVSGTLTLSQTSVSITSPNSATVVASPSSGGNVSVTSNSNASVANVFVSGASVIITGQSTGSTTLTVCSTVSATQCGNILVTVNGGSSTTLNFSNANPVVIAGQSSNITIYSPSNSNSSAYYISSNSNSNIVSSPSISGSTLYFSGGTPGNATLSICQTGSSYCGTVTVTVGSNGQNGLTISPSSLVLTAGNTGTATINNSTAALSITNNSNSAVVSASVSSYVSGQTGQTVTVYAVAAGSSTLTICPAGSTSGCVYLFVQVGSSGTTTTGGISFSLQNPVMTVGQSQSIAIYSTNGVNTYTISNNTSASIVSLSLSGSSLYLVGQNVGSSTITVCQTSSTVCGTLYVTVNGAGGGLTFSPSNVNVALNQNQTVSITGGSGSYYISNNSNPSAAAVSLQSNSLYVTGLNAGTSSVTVCQNNNSSVCGVMSITVASAAAGTGTITFSNNSPALGLNQTQAISISGGSGTYYISGITNPSALTLNLSGSQLSLTGITVGNASVSICQTGGSSCATLNVTVNSSSASPTPTPTPTAVPTPTPTPVATTGSYVNGQLINENGTIALVYKNTKTPFANAAAFLGLGFKFANLTVVSNSGLALSGKVVVTANGAHPRGSWLLSGKAVYFLTPEGLIPVPDWNTFLSNGGQASFLVKANSYDLAMAKLSVMTASDARLK